MEKFIILAAGIFQIQVCAEATFDETLAWVRTNRPAGTSNNWQKDEREEVKPITCADHPERTHYLFDC